ncbi:SRPBCC family protein [Streptomyces decoyicus]|uniref:SRPBCC family protein n=1 Tax=Streptomyces decoyicus TaxID=249567 RepID=UPI0036374C07
MRPAFDLGEGPETPSVQGGLAQHFEVVTVIAAPPDQVFAVRLDVESHTRSMADSSERAVGGKTRGELALEDTVTFQARRLGFTWRLKAHITSYDRPRSFVDEQESGPFKRWRHAHHFEPDGHGGTIMRDTIDFASPLGPVGRIIDQLLLRRYMPRPIRIRNGPGCYGRCACWSSWRTGRGLSALRFTARRLSARHPTSPADAPRVPAPTHRYGQNCPT